MAVIVGHASIGESGKSRGGLAGDQTGKEVCSRNWYDKKWDYVLRPVSTALAENSARICEIIITNDNVGYDMDNRNSLWNEWLRSKKISPITKVECDCSALMAYCAILGGANIDYGKNAPTTANMKTKFTAGGSYKILTEKKYRTSSDYLKRGDILVSENDHTVMALSDGAKTIVSSNTIIEIPNATIRKGAKGDNVKALQIALNTIFVAGLDTDGSFGPKTYDAVKAAQRTLKIIGLYTSDIDGIYGPGTKKALKKYAQNKGYKIK